MVYSLEVYSALEHYAAKKMAYSPSSSSTIRIAGREKIRTCQSFRPYIPDLFDSSITNRVVPSCFSSSMSHHTCIARTVLG